MKLEFYRQIFEKYSNIRFHKTPSSGSRVVHGEGGTAEGHDEANSRIVTFRDLANASKMTTDIYS
jgi:hypothetical protein